MDRETWQATIHGVVRVRHDLATKPPPCHLDNPEKIWNFIRKENSQVQEDCIKTKD